MYALMNLPIFNNSFNELRSKAIEISQMFEKVSQKIQGVSEAKSEGGSVLFTFFGVELKLQAEIDPKGIQNGNGKLRTYKINPLPEKHKKLDIEFAFDRLSNITYEKDGKVTGNMMINTFPKHYIELLMPIVLEDCTIILDK